MRVGDRRADQPDTKRVHRRAALANLEMQVRASGEPARPDIADHLPCPDEAPRLGDDVAHMSVEADDPTAMGDLNFTAVAAGPAGADHLPVAGGDARAAPTGADI